MIDHDIQKFFGVMMTLVVCAITLVSGLVVLKKVAGGKRTSDLPPAELDAVHARLDNVDALERRVAELEERLDFTERMLTQHRETERLPGG